MNFTLLDFRVFFEKFGDRSNNFLINNGKYYQISGKIKSYFYEVYYSIYEKIIYIAYLNAKENCIYNLYYNATFFKYFVFEGYRGML